MLTLAVVQTSATNRESFAILGASTLIAAVFGALAGALCAIACTRQEQLFTYFKNR